MGYLSKEVIKLEPDGTTTLTLDELIVDNLYLGGPPQVGSRNTYFRFGASPVPGNSTTWYVFDICRFNFASEIENYNVVSASSTNNGTAGSGTSSQEKGYIVYQVSRMDSFPFAIEGATQTVTTQGPYTGAPVSFPPTHQIDGDFSYADSYASLTHGYVSDNTPGAPFETGYSVNYVRFPFVAPEWSLTPTQTFSFHTEGTGSPLYVGARAAYTFSSLEYGYRAGGQDSPSYIDSITKFPFAATTTYIPQSTVGNLTTAKSSGQMVQSDTTAFVVAGGRVPGSSPFYPTIGAVTDIESFPFASDTNAISVGDLLTARRSGIGAGSVSGSGYVFKGVAVGTPYATRYNNPTEKFPFAISSGTATSIVDYTAIDYLGQNITRGIID